MKSLFLDAGPLFEVRAERHFALQHARVRRHSVRHPHVTPDDRVMSHGDASQHTRVTVNYHVVFDDRVAREIEQCAVFRRFEVACAERHALIEANTAADDARRPNHHARAVVDGKLRADFCARVDVDPGARMRQFADNARNDRHPRAMQNVRHAVMHYRLYRRVAQDHFGVARRRGVSIIYGAHVESERVSQRRDGLHELLRERFGATRLAHHAAGGFNLAIEDARELRQAFEGGAGGEKSRKHEIAEERHGFFYARRLDIVGLTLRNIGIGHGQLRTQVGNFFGGKRSLHEQSDEIRRVK